MYVYMSVVATQAFTVIFASLGGLKYFWQSNIIFSIDNKQNVNKNSDKDTRKILYIIY